MGLFSKKKYPEFWKAYESTFSEKLPQQIEENRFVVFDTETTGLNPSEDKLLSMGSVSLQNNKIVVGNSFEVFIAQEKFNRETVSIHGIRKQGNLQKIPEAEALQRFLEYIGNSILVAHHTAFDVTMINRALKSMQLPKLKNRLIDTAQLYAMLLGKPQQPVSLDALCKELKVAQHDRHNALGDALITAQVFQKILKRLQKERTVKLHDLLMETQHTKLF